MMHCTVCVPIAAVLSSPSRQAICTSEALYGECVVVLEDLGDWVKVRQHRDGYVGFMESRELEAQSPQEQENMGNHTHWVQTKSTLLFEKPDFKSRVVHRIPFASLLQLHDCPAPAYSETLSGHYVWKSHCLQLNARHPLSPLELARSHFLGLPYRWGGRSTAGVDCSGLVQLLAHSHGLGIPRDSGDQEQFIKTRVDDSDYRAMDLVYWPGHVGILASPDQLLHATAHSMHCLVEPLDAVIARAGPVSSVRRLFS